MRNLSIALLLIVTLSLPGCLSSLPWAGGQTSAASLGPDGPTEAETATSIPSILPARIDAGISWLWASYTKLHDAGALPGLDDLRADIVDLEAVAHRGDLVAALDLYARARARVTAIVGVMGK